MSCPNPETVLQAARRREPTAAVRRRSFVSGVIGWFTSIP
jgi:hypothetical protein